MLFKSNLSPLIHGGLCYCVWAIISDGDEWMNGHGISHSCTGQARGRRQNCSSLVLIKETTLEAHDSVYRAWFVVMGA